MMIGRAGPDDAPAIVALVNGAYRGAGAERGWTHEAALLDGQRTDEATIDALVRQPRGAILLLRPAAGGAPAGCVVVEPTNDPATWAIGMLTVDPARQAGGFGRRLLQAAEDHARTRGAARTSMSVIGSRATLIAWYERRGYRLTRETKPFPYGDERFGRPRRDDLRFVMLDKEVGPAAPP